MARHGSGRAAHDLAVRERMACIDVLERWQRINTAFYWHLRPSLLIAGPDQLTDTRWIDTLFEGRVADGRTLCAVGHLTKYATTVVTVRLTCFAGLPPRSSKLARRVLSSRLMQLRCMRCGCCCRLRRLVRLVVWLISMTF